MPAMTVTPGPSVEDIAGMTDPVLRNLWITQRYHEFAIGLRDAGVGEDATWCAFAVWASKTAGATIRGEVLPARAKELIDNDATESVLHRFNHGVTAWAWKRLSHDHLARAVEGVTADVSSRIAGGNVLVFAELAPIFTALLREWRRAPATPEDLAAALAPTLASAGEGTEPVKAAFSSYEHAMFGPEERAFQVLQANTMAVAHEQHRLQPAISGALNAAITDTVKKVIEEDVVLHVPTSEARRVVDDLTDDVCSALGDAWDTALTEAIMQLVTARETLDLRKDVPPLSGTMFPPPLHDLTGTIAADAVAQWDRTRGAGTPSGAHDWAVMEERMNFIVNLFRSRQRDPSLFDPPFSEAQLAELAEGRRPPDPL
jgi:hypothetical protein